MAHDVHGSLGRTGAGFHGVFGDDWEEPGIFMHGAALLLPAPECLRLVVQPGQLSQAQGPGASAHELHPH